MTAEVSLLTRTLKLGSVGLDVTGVKRSVFRHLGKDLRPLNKSRLSVQRTYGPFFVKDVLKSRQKLGLSLKPTVDQEMWHYLLRAGAPDALAIDQMQRYIDNHKPQPPAPTLIEPKQGFNSLKKELWPLYTEGRKLGLWDLGTYNPASRLPSGKPSDHAVYPAVAFDLGFSPANGYGNPIARSFFHSMAGNPLVSYVILGGEIWSEEKGLHAYINTTDHAGHVHVSGHR